MEEKYIDEYEGLFDMSEDELYEEAVQVCIDISKEIEKAKELIKTIKG